MSLGCIHPFPLTCVSLARGPARFDGIAGVLLVCAALSGCAKGTPEGDDNYVGDGTFGSSGEPSPEDAGAESLVPAANMDGGLVGDGVRLRIFHGVPNLPGARFCHDPDYVVDDPRTDPDETANGPEEPRWLPLGDGGVVSFAETTDYVMLPAMTGGAITIHRAPMPPLPMDPPAPADAALADGGLDGGTDARVADASSLEGGSVDAGGPCDPGTLEAILPLPMTAAWLSPERDQDAALEPERRGFVAAAIEGDTLTLFGSGLALDPAELMRRGEAARQARLAMEPENVVGAGAEARRQMLSLQSTYGARFLLARGQIPAPQHFALSLAHLVPDVPAALPGRPSVAGSGALRLCVTTDKKDSEPADGGVSRFEFRNVMGIGSNLDPALSYRFRVFVEAEYQSGSNSCATTSLKPVAKLDVDAGTFAADRSYTLVTWGAYDPVSACTSPNASALIKQGCARPVDTLGARIDIVPNELPTP